jgi:hypothetical protein
MNSFNIHRFACGLVLCAALLFLRPVLPQGNMIVEMEQMRVRRLTGIVTDQTGAPVPGAIVQDCDSSFKNVLVVRKADEKGQFSFPRAMRGTHHYLQVVFPGLNLTRIPVIIDRDGEDQLRIPLSVGT